MPTNERLVADFMMTEPNPTARKPFSILPEGIEVLWPEDYGVHPRHCADVLAGSYDIPFDPEKPPVILDVGANVGAFTKWAAYRWPGSTIFSYEPYPNNFKLLTRTVESVKDLAHIGLNQVAVSDKGGNMVLKFHSEAMNCGEWSLNTGGTPKDTVNVDVIPALDLPKADILKIDTEGAEAQILESMKYRLHEFSAVMLEIHSASWVVPITGLLRIAGFSIISKEVKFNSENRVEMKFLKTNLIK